jgi:hypothetical protein
MQIETPEQAKEYIESKGIQIIPGKAYNVYKCGCVYLDDEDPNRMKWFADKKHTTRCCPEHISGLLNKFKLCKCGQTYFSSRVQASEKCSSCYGIKIKIPGQYKGKAKARSKLKNIHLQDLERWDCSGRSECLDEFFKHQCTPCLGCEKYSQKTLDISDYLCSNGNTASTFFYQHREAM